MFLCVGLEDIYEFRLVADTGQPPISTDEWLLLHRLLVYMQPARSAALEGDPPRSILVHGYGGPDPCAYLPSGSRPARLLVGAM
jgi:hypothetical protein